MDKRTRGFVLSYKVEGPFECVTWKIFDDDCLKWGWEWVKLAETCSLHHVSNEDYMTETNSVTAV